MNFINSLSYRTLGTISVVGITACAWISYKVHLQRFETIKQTSLFKEAISSLREHEGAIRFLGQPIKDGKIMLQNVTRLNERIKLNEVKVDVAGPKSNGVMYFYVHQNVEVPEKTFLGEVQLQIGKDKTKRLVVKHAPES